MIGVCFLICLLVLHWEVKWRTLELTSLLVSVLLCCSQLLQPTSTFFSLVFPSQIVWHIFPSSYAKFPMSRKFLSDLRLKFISMLCSLLLNILFVPDHNSPLNFAESHIKMILVLSLFYIKK